MFTGEVPYGEEYKKIASVSPELARFDRVVAEMLRRDPNARPASIDAVKTLLLKYEAEDISRQKLHDLSKVVIPQGQNPDPLAHRPPTIVDVDWKNGNLTLIFDQPLSHGFIQGLLGMGSYHSVMGKPPQAFSYKGNTASIGAGDHEVQAIVDHFKAWLPRATATYDQRWKAENERARYLEEQELKRARDEEERRLKLRGSIKL